MIPGLGVFWVIAFVLLLAIVLDRLLFKPLTRVMDERQTRVRAALDLARESAEHAAAATAQFEARTRAAQADVYRQMDDVRRAALGQRQDLLERTRDEIEASIGTARARLTAQADRARAETRSPGGRTRGRRRHAGARTQGLLGCRTHSSHTMPGRRQRCAPSRPDDACSRQPARLPRSCSSSVPPCSQPRARPASPLNPPPGKPPSRNRAAPR